MQIITRYSAEHSANFKQPASITEKLLEKGIFVNENYCSVSGTSQFIIHNAHNWVMGDREAHFFKKMGVVLLLDIASIIVVPCAIIETLIRIVVTACLLFHFLIKRDGEIFCKNIFFTYYALMMIFSSLHTACQISTADKTTELWCPGERRVQNFLEKLFKDDADSSDDDGPEMADLT